ncbi:type 1 glutamine amidotransferase [soil metagenome]
MSSSRGSSPRVLVVQHLPHEHAGVLGEVLVTSGCTVRTCRAWTEPVPRDLTDVDAVVVLGGDMNTDEGKRWPHLGDVRALLADAVASDVPVLALCLGAQLLAEATGGRVHHGTPEVGYIPIHRTPEGHVHPVIGAVPDGSRWFNAHGDQITAPPGATLLARSDDTPVHAFQVGRALGLQFHPEVDASAVAAYVETRGIAEYLEAAGWTGERLLTEARRCNEAHRAAGRTLFEAWLATV